MRPMGYDPVSDQASPKEGDRKCNRNQTLSSDFYDWHPGRSSSALRKSNPVATGGWSFGINSTRRLYCGQTSTRGCLVTPHTGELAAVTDSASGFVRHFGTIGM